MTSVLSLLPCTVQPRPPTDGRRALTPAQLIDLTRLHADDVRRGRYPFITFDRDARWHRRIYRDPRVDVWLISWLPGQATQLHDHGGSAGAFSVVSGQLVETVWVPDGVGRGRIGVRRHRAGRDVAFDASHVHDVSNGSDLAAVSVHAYSPALSGMGFYDVTGGVLTLRTVLPTDDPEPDAP